MLIFTLEKHMVDEEAKLKRYVRVAEFRSEDGLGWPKDQKATTIQATSISFSSQCDFSLVVLLFFLQRSLCRGSPAAKNMADDINDNIHVPNSVEVVVCRGYSPVLWLRGCCRQCIPLCESSV